MLWGGDDGIGIFLSWFAEGDDRALPVSPEAAAENDLRARAVLEAWVYGDAGCYSRDHVIAEMVWDHDIEL